MSDSNSTVSLEVTGPAGDLFPPITDVPWEQGMNVQQEMEAAFNTREQSFHFFLEYFGSSGAEYLGYTVTRFNDVEEQDPYYWFFYINGSLSGSGIDSHVLNAGDAVQWKYQQWSDEEHGGFTLLRADRDRVRARTSAG